MGGGTFDPGAYATTAASYASKPRAAVFKSHGLKPSLDPLNVTRESRDSADNPNSTPVAVFTDVTGSMGHLAELIAKGSVGVLFNEIFARKPITDPHVAFGAIGDAYADRAPLQVSQFEADNRIVDQLVDTYIEGGGGGGGNESYNLAWYMAGMHMSHDSFEKRGKKGYIFTIGDENVHPSLTRSQIKEIFGDDVQEDISNEALLKMAQKTFHVFHLIVEQSGYALTYLPAWRKLLGQNALILSDTSKVSEVIVSTMQVIEGATVADVTKSWSGGTAIAVNTAIKDLSPIVGGKSTAVKRFS